MVPGTSKAEMASLTTSDTPNRVQSEYTEKELMVFLL